jgi:5-formyltetrahydrofolate cyclo-ligase
MAIASKAELRQEYLKKRGELDPQTRWRFSSLIRQRILQLPAWRNSTTILCYAGFGSEVDTRNLMDEAFRLKKRLVVPMWDPENRETNLSEIHRLGELASRAKPYLLEPAPEFRRPVSPSAVLLALVPGLVFDRTGGRIGFGGGYFDRLIPKMPMALTVGLAFSLQINPEVLPHEAHDARVRMIITESETIDAVTKSP